MHISRALPPCTYVSALHELTQPTSFLCILKTCLCYRPRSEGYNVLGCIRPSVRPSVHPLPLSRLNNHHYQSKVIV